ncbi:MAG: hypothetical protein GC159_02355 [Phycisphaera sp.]|nr:hypothetical protein [Phycisphaera sp.]
MQRTEQGGVIISCDFCGVDWDAYDESMSNPMVEGHRGSVICLSCLKQALEHMAPAESEFMCTLCVNEKVPAGTERWFHPSPTPSPGLNAHAVVCRACIRQAAGRFNKDKDVDWTWEYR